MAVARVHTAAEGDVAAAHPYAGRLCGLCQVGAVVWATDAGFRIRGTAQPRRSTYHSVPKKHGSFQINNHSKQY